MRTCYDNFPITYSDLFFRRLDFNFLLHLPHIRTRPRFIFPSVALSAELAVK